MVLLNVCLFASEHKRSLAKPSPLVRGYIVFASLNVREKEQLIRFQVVEPK
jgi:hypothetical protein